jgi:hypothetical protein
MTNRSNLLLLTPALLLLACGDLKTPQAHVGQVRYKTNGDIAAFLPRELVTFDGQLVAEKQRVPFVGPPAGRQVIAESISKDGGIAAVSWGGGTNCGIEEAAVFRVVEQELLLKIPCAQELELSPSGDLLAVVGAYTSPEAAKVRVYDVASGRELWSDQAITNQFVFSPDGTRLYATTVGGSGLGSWDARTGELLMRVPPPAAPPQDLYSMIQVAVSLDGQRLLVALPHASSFAADYGWFRTSDLLLESIVSQAPNYDMVSALAVSADSQRFATIAHRTAGIPPRIQMWTSSGSLLYAIDTPFIGELGFSPDGSALVATPYPDPDSPGVSLFRVSDGGLIASHTFSTDPL